MTFNREMVTLLSLSGCPLFTTAGRASFVCFRGATAREMSERADPAAHRPAGRDLGRALGGRGGRSRGRRPENPAGSPGPADAPRVGHQPLCEQRRGLRARPPGACGGHAGLEALPPPQAPGLLGPRAPGLLAGGRGLNSAPDGPGLGPASADRDRTPGSDGWSAWASPRSRLRKEPGPPSPRPPPPSGPPGGALASSPGRTWLPAPGLPSPARSPRAGRRPGSCSGPGCSTPPPWGCGRGSCRSRLGRRRGRQAGDPTRAPPPETRPEAATRELQGSDPCPRPPGGAGPRRGLAGFQAQGPAKFTLLRVGLSQLFHPRLREDFFFFSPFSTAFDFRLPSSFPREIEWKEPESFPKSRKETREAGCAVRPSPNPGSTRD